MLLLLLLRETEERPFVEVRGANASVDEDSMASSNGDVYLIFNDVLLYYMLVCNWLEWRECYRTTSYYCRSLSTWSITCELEANVKKPKTPR